MYYTEKSTINFDWENNDEEILAASISEGVMIDIWDYEDITIKDSIKIAAANNIDTEPEDLLETYSNPDMSFYFDLAETVYDCNDELFTIIRNGEYLQLVSEMCLNLNNICRNAIIEYLCACKITVIGEDAKKISKMLKSDIISLANDFEYEDGMYCYEVIPKFEDDMYDCFEFYENEYNVKINIE